MLVTIRPQDVRRHDGIDAVGLGSARAMPIPIAGRGQRVDGEHLATRRHQGGNEQTLRGLDRHRHEVARILTAGRQELDQLGEAVRVVGDATLGHDGAARIDHGDVMMIVGPVDATSQVGQEPLLSPAG
jgi:hypothetical protein